MASFRRPTTTSSSAAARAAQGHRERDRRNTFSKRPDRGQPPEISKGVLAHRTAHWVHLGRDEVEQSQHEQIQCRGDGRDEGREAHGVIPARHPDMLQSR